MFLLLGGFWLGYTDESLLFMLLSGLIAGPSSS
jgi:hypothetical protein